MIEEFLNEKTPTAKAKAEKALMQQVLVNGREFTTRKALIEHRVNTGSVIAVIDDEEVLLDKNDCFFTKKDITKTALDYAKYLIDRSANA